MHVIKPTDYTYVSKGDIEAIKILKLGKWQNTIFTFNIKPHKAVDNKIPIEFEFKVLVKSPEITWDDYSTEEFGLLAEEIIKSILKEIGDLC